MGTVVDLNNRKYDVDECLCELGFISEKVKDLSIRTICMVYMDDNDELTLYSYNREPLFNSEKVRLIGYLEYLKALMLSELD
jgi:hypothetical protein